MVELVDEAQMLAAQRRARVPGEVLGLAASDGDRAFETAFQQADRL